MRALRSAVALGAIVAGVALGVPISGSAQADPLTGASIRVVVVDVSRPAPTRSAAPVAIRFQVQLTNTTREPLTAISVDAERGAPIDTQAALTSALTNPTPSDNQQSQSIGVQAVPGTLAAGSTVTITVATTVGIPTTSGICQCHDGVYPIEFSVAAATDADSTPVRAGYGQTYLPTFLQTPRPVSVTWVWPLLDRPHRAVSPDVFSDDTLRVSVSTGGRLDRALRVLEGLPNVPVTVVLDPEIIDELAVMQTGYRVDDATGKSTTGTGGPAAAAWLARLRAVVARHEVTLSLPADPDIDALAQAGRSARTSFGVEQQEQVARALGTTISPSELWPAGGSLSTAGLRAATALGARTLVLDDHVLPGSGYPDAPAQIASSGVTALLTDQTLNQQADASLGAGGGAYLAPLLAEVAVRAAADPTQQHTVVLTPSRYVDPDPAVAIRSIRTTMTSGWSVGRTVAQAALLPARARGSFTDPTDPADLSLGLDTITGVEHSLSAVGSALNATDRAALLANYPAALQRLASVAWRSYPQEGYALAAIVAGQASLVERSVTLTPPAQGNYTLASDDSYLFVTAVNRLAYPVTVTLSLTTVGGVAGFRVDDAGAQVIPAQGRYTFRMKAHVLRAGRFQVEAELASAGANRQLDQQQVSVHSTALGTIGVIITTVATIVLALALIVRVTVRLRRRRSLT